MVIAPIKGVLEGIVTVIQTLGQVVENIFSSLGDILSRLNPTSEKFLLKDFVGFMNAIISYINPFSEKFLMKPIIDLFNDVLSYFNPFSDKFILKDILSYLNPFSDKFILKTLLNYLNPFSEDFILKGLLDLFGTLLDYLNPFSDNFILKVAFIPKEGFFSEKFDKLNEIIFSKFPFIEQLANIINPNTFAVTYATSAPNLSFTLPKKYGGGTYQLVNFDYFAQYKDFIFSFIRVMIWFPFAKWLYGRIPSLINGGMAMDYRNQHTTEVFAPDTGESMGYRRTR